MTFPNNPETVANTNANPFRKALTNGHVDDIRHLLRGTNPTPQEVAFYVGVAVLIVAWAYGLKPTF